MPRSRRADAVIFGFDFQVNAAVVLMIENIRDLESLRLEGNYEDIELKLNDIDQAIQLLSHIGIPCTNINFFDMREIA